MEPPVPSHQNGRHIRKLPEEAEEPAALAHVVGVALDEAARDAPAAQA